MTVRVDHDGPVTIVTMDRPAVRNAVDRATADELLAVFEEFDADPAQRVAVLYGDGGTFCSGADLKAMDQRLEPDGPGPMGPTRLRLTKPVIAAVEGYAVAGGLELAIWCDLRVAAKNASFGVFSRRFGVPLIDGGTFRLPRLIGTGRAMDLILTGREIGAVEAERIGLVNWVVDPGAALQEAVSVAWLLEGLPQACLRNDRLSVLVNEGVDTDTALTQEFRIGLESLASGAAARGAERFTSGEGRGGGALPEELEP